MSLLSVGASLRHEREVKGLSLKEVADTTRIPVHHLEAIESDRLDLLPGLVFARNFVRQYATALNLDAASLLMALPKIDPEAAPLPAAPKTPRSERWDSRDKGLLSTAAWGAAMVIGCVAAYHYLNIATNPTSVHASPAAETQAQKQTEAKVETPAPPAETTVQTIPVSAPESPKAIQEAEQTKPVEVVITASQPSWVSLTADGKPAFSGTLQPNESKQVSASETVKLVAGNAGGVTVSLNGKTLDPIGPAGQVRVVRLTAEGPEFLVKAPSSPAPDPL